MVTKKTFSYREEIREVLRDCPSSFTNDVLGIYDESYNNFQSNTKLRSAYVFKNNVFKKIKISQDDIVSTIKNKIGAYLKLSYTDVNNVYFSNKEKLKEEILRVELEVRKLTGKIKYFSKYRPEEIGSLNIFYNKKNRLNAYIVSLSNINVENFNGVLQFLNILISEELEKQGSFYNFEKFLDEYFSNENNQVGIVKSLFTTAIDDIAKRLKKNSERNFNLRTSCEFSHYLNKPMSNREFLKIIVDNDILKVEDDESATFEKSGDVK